MRLGITIEDKRGIDGNVSQHFGQCRYFFIVDIDNGKITGTRTITNEHSSGGGGRHAVNSLLKHNISHIISGGMGMGAQEKFNRAGIKISGFKGSIKDAIISYQKHDLPGLGKCEEHGDCYQESK